MSRDDRKSFDALVEAAESEDEADYLRKGLAAGRGVDELRGFAGKIRGKGPRWMDEMLSLRLETSGAGVQQRWWSPCGATMAEALRGELDPVHALEIHEAGRKAERPAEPRSLAERLEALQETTGLSFQTQLIGRDTTLPEALLTIDRALAADAPVPLLLGQSPDDPARHVLATGVNGGVYAIHDPWDGATVTRTADQMANGTLGVAGHGFLAGLLAPTVQRAAAARPPAPATAAATRLEQSQASPQELGATLEALRLVLPLHEGTAAARAAEAAAEALMTAGATLGQDSNPGVAAWLEAGAGAVQDEAELAAWVEDVQAVVRLYALIAVLGNG